MFSGKITGRIFTSRDPFTITVRTVFEPIQIGRHESHNFVFSGLVPTLTFDSMLHNVSLTYIYNVLARKRVDKRNPPKRAWWFLLRGISYPRLLYAANANCESFAVTFFSFNIYSDVLSTLLLFALSKLCRPIKKRHVYKQTQSIA